MTSSNSSLNVLNDVIAVNLHVSIWTGRKMLEDSDFSLSGEALPREIINLGSKHTTDPKALTETWDVEKHINAAYSMFHIKSAQLDSSIDTGLSSQVESLSGSLEDDVLKNAKKLLDSLTGAIRPSQTNVNSLKETA